MIDILKKNLYESEKAKKEELSKIRTCILEVCHHDRAG